MWLGALALRAIVVLAAALWWLTAVSGSAAFHALDGAVLHPLGHALPLLPLCLVAGSLALAGVRAGWSSLRLGRAIRRGTLGDGPFGSLLVADPGLSVGVPVVGRARPIVSHGALTALDDGELAATIAHEVGHLRRRHRPLRVTGAALAAVAFPLPGTAAALRGLRLSLERDADEFAVRTTGRPLSLASAICKVAAQSPSLRPARPAEAVLRLAGAGRASMGLSEPGAFAPSGFGRLCPERRKARHGRGMGATELRLEQLLAGGRERAGSAGERAARLLAAAIGLACGAAATVTLTVLAPPASLGRGVALAFQCAG